MHPTSCHWCQSLSCVCSLPMPSIIPAHSRYAGAGSPLDCIGLPVPFSRLFKVTADCHFSMCSRIPTGYVVCKLEPSFPSPVIRAMRQDICHLEEFIHSKIILLLSLKKENVLGAMLFWWFFSVPSLKRLAYLFLPLFSVVYWENLLGKAITHGCFEMYFCLDLFSLFHCCWLCLKALCPFLNSVTRDLK